MQPTPLTCGPSLAAQEAVESDGPSVSDSLLQALDGAPQPGVLRPAPEPPASPRRAAPAPAGVSGVLPVAVTPANQQTEAEAAQALAVDASLAAEEEAPEAAAAAEMAAAAAVAQPEGIDATPEYLAGGLESSQ